MKIERYHGIVRNLKASHIKLRDQATAFLKFKEKINLGRAMEIAKNLPSSKNKEIFTKLIKLTFNNYKQQEKDQEVLLEDLYFDTIEIGKAKELKRFTPCGRGKSSIIHKHYSNIYVKIKKKMNTKFAFNGVNNGK